MTQSKSEQELRREHALHNELACAHLKTDGNFPDWVVTTAFYSANHFVKYKLFPLNENGQDYDTSEFYYQAHKQRNGYGNRHEVLILVVRRHLPKNVASAYKELYELCNTARYFNYETNPQDVDLAASLLQEVKGFCNTNKPAQEPPIKATHAFKRRKK